MEPAWTEDRDRYYFTPPGQAELAKRLDDGCYHLARASESALLWAASLGQAGREQEQKKLLQSLRGLVIEGPLYPSQWTAGPTPGAFGRVTRFTVEDLHTQIASYRWPLETLRRREALLVWRPLYERLLMAVSQTNQEGWPFQTYPPGWTARVTPLVREISSALEGEVACHFPQRSESNLRHLVECVSKALVNPASLTGREVSLARRILSQSEQRWGPLGSAWRDQQRARESRLAGEPSPEEWRTELLTRLDMLPAGRGLEASSLELVLAPFRGHAVPAFLQAKVSRAREGSLSELAQWGLVASAEVLNSLLAQLVANSASVALDGAPAALAYRTFLAHRGSRSCDSWLSLPWLGCWPIRASHSTESRALAREALAVIGKDLPEYDLRMFPLPDPVAAPAIRSLSELIEESGFATDWTELCASALSRCDRLARAPAERTYAKLHRHRRVARAWRWVEEAWLRCNDLDRDTIRQKTRLRNDSLQAIFQRLVGGQRGLLTERVTASESVIDG